MRQSEAAHEQRTTYAHAASATPPRAPTNRLIAALPKPSAQRIADMGSTVGLAHQQLIASKHERLSHVWFPTSGLVSMVATTRGGLSIQVAAVGPEGIVGVPWCFGSGAAGTDLVAITSGRALRVPLDRFSRLLESDEDLCRMVFRFSDELTRAVCRNAACHRLHDASQRLARWLLHAQASLGNQQIFATHEILGQLLGIRRASVTQAVGDLQAAGSIEWSRGSVRIVNKAELEHLACECYGEALSEYSHLDSD